MNDWKEKEYIPKECGECDAIKRCLGGCRTAAEACNGSLKAPPYLIEKPLKLREEIQETSEKELNIRLTVANNLKFREEINNHYLVYRTPQKIAFINKSELHLLALIKKDYSNGFNIDELLRRFELEDCYRTFFNHLKNRGIFVQTQGGTKK